MLQARFNLVTADPDRMADAVGYIKSEIRPAVESLHGSMGMSLYVNPEVGVAVLAARVRVETVKSTGCVIRALEEYDLVFNPARIGGV